MKVYDLKGVIVDGTTAVIAVSLPKEVDGNVYSINVKERFDDSGVDKLKIEMTDLFDLDLSSSNNGNFVTCLIDLADYGYTDDELKKEIKVVFYHLESKNKDLSGEIIAKGTGVIKP
jgi:hypothetical protein